MRGYHTISFLESEKKADRSAKLDDVDLCLLLSIWICSSSCCSWLARTLGPATFGCSVARSKWPLAQRDARSECCDHSCRVRVGPLRVQWEGLRSHFGV